MCHDDEMEWEEVVMVQRKEMEEGERKGKKGLQKVMSWRRLLVRRRKEERGKKKYWETNGREGDVTGILERETLPVENGGRE